VKTRRSANSRLSHAICCFALHTTVMSEGCPPAEKEGKDRQLLSATRADKERRKPKAYPLACLERSY